MTKLLRIFHAKDVLPFIAIFLIGFSIYSNVLQGEFVSDDYHSIVNNPAIRDVSNLGGILEAFNTRFLVGVTFALNYKIGKLEVFGYHIINILIHIFVSFLIFHFVRLTLQLYSNQTQFNQSSYSIAFLSSLIFLCHPVQTESVSFITQRFSLIATSCYLLTIIFYIKARLSSKRVYLFLSLGSMFLGMFSKEFIITVPITLIVYEIYFFKEEKIRIWQKLRKVLPFFLLILLLPIAFYQEHQASVFTLKDTFLHRSIDLNYFLTEINVLKTYLRLLILPINQNHAYDYPIVQSFLEPIFLFSFCLLASLWVLAIYLFSRKRLMSFCLFWFFITTSVEFVVVSIVNSNVIFEHWLYLPMVGLSTLVSLIFHEVFKKKQSLKWAAIVFLIALSIATYNRNKVWQSETGFWQDVVRKSPNIATPYFAVGNAYKRQGNDQRAVSYFNKALNIDPNFVDALNNLGVFYAKRGEKDLAVKYFKRILEVDSEFSEAYTNIGYYYYLKGSYNESIQYYQESIKRTPSYSDGYSYLGTSFLKIGDLKKAETHFKKALNLYTKQNMDQRAGEMKIILESIRQSLSIKR